MESKSVIYSKLEAFIRKFYTNEVVKGLLLFIGLGLLYFIFTLLVEHFLWLSTLGRTILFWLFISVELFLLAKFIVLPIFKLVKLQKGIDYTDASKIIGNHFSEVGDKLLNFLQLSNTNEQSELLIASIDQKANALQPIPFSNAIDFKGNKKYLPFAIIPILLFVLFYITGNSSVLENSLNRVVHYETAYAPPAPFTFQLLTDDLKVEQNKSFTLKVTTKGNVVPEQVKIHFNNESYFLEKNANGQFEYTFESVKSSTDFYLEANSITSNNYSLEVVNVPTIVDFSMRLTFPSYLRKASETIKGNGNAIVPEGTLITWNIATKATEEIQLKAENSYDFKNVNGLFNFSKSIRSDFNYQIITSNSAVKQYEKLGYTITTIKDQFPSISAQIAPDSLKLKEKVIIGNVSDDYGLSKLQVVYYDVNNREILKRANLPVKTEFVDRFVYTFPSGLRLEEGKKYDYYFEVFDNDQVNGSKSSKSSIFSYYELTQTEKEDKTLQEQQENINALEKSLQNQDKQLSELDKLQKLNKEKSNLDFKDQKKIQDFVDRQKKQEELMKEFSKNLEENLEEFKTENNEQKEELQRRLEEFQKESEKNEELLKELEELSKKLQKEELFDKADKLKQNAKTQKMNLEQLVELTKRFYVEQKAQQLADKLQNLGDKQEKLADDKQNNSKENQEKINKEFEDIKEELNQLDKENESLKRPMDLDVDDKEQENIEEDLNKATEELEQNNKEKASPKQKSAGEKMKEIGEKMSASMMSGGMETMQEDAQLLRQIVDNLLTFSFDEEKLMKETKEASKTNLQFNKALKKQQSLKVQFKHIDDSLFSVALRNPMISEVVFKEVGEVHYNIDKALEVLAENNIYKGTSHQQFALSSANKLADFLSNVQSQMQMQMSGMGQGKPKPGGGQGDMQLKDIIKKQGELGEGMKKGMQPGEQDGDQKGQKPGEKNPGQSGQSGSEGENGQEGNAGKILDILKEQKQLRDALEKELKKEGLGGIGQNALNQMKDIEKQLINKGFKNETLNKMMNLKHELLKLEKAIQQQGEDNKRKSNTNKDSFNGTSSPLPSQLKDYLNSIEILNRQSLPLHPNYNQKVQEYFKSNDNL
ncbi:hypothetical protein [Flavobacterium okayamense]|uniref:ATPase n=1 Tax=Flavobacterium okayamense TaxID=2830782 RepID=A0ABN6HVJ3_9FLAO|nr:hypothetical protein [Flavobacterium okayamense]BCY27800.1 ATPase [Flavobacterium okayamense]